MTTPRYRKPYDHGRFAGSIGDVFKHRALLAVCRAEALAHVAKGESSRPFRYFESHAGAGSYDLRPYAFWRRGIARLEAIDETAYQGSWARVAAVIAGICAYELVLCEADAGVMARARSAAAGLPAAFRAGDGFAALANASGVDLAFVDPPYILRDGPPGDWDFAAEALANTLQAARSVLVWYPVFGHERPTELMQRCGSVGHEIWWETAKRGCDLVPKGCGLTATGPAAAALEAARPELDALATALEAQYVRRAPTPERG